MISTIPTLSKILTNLTVPLIPDVLRTAPEIRNWVQNTGRARNSELVPGNYYATL